MERTGSQIKFKTSVLKLSLCDQSDASVVVKGIVSATAVPAFEGNNNKVLIFKNCAPFTDRISEINNT